MAAKYCSCGNQVGDCGHVAGGTTASITISGTCARCGKAYSIKCTGSCLGGLEEEELPMIE
jgi:hypothetical protein